MTYFSKADTARLQAEQDAGMAAHRAAAKVAHAETLARFAPLNDANLEAACDWKNGRIKQILKEAAQ